MASGGCCPVLGCRWAVPHQELWAAVLWGLWEDWDVAMFMESTRSPLGRGQQGLCSVLGGCAGPMCLFSTQRRSAWKLPARVLVPGFRLFIFQDHPGGM